MRGIVLRIAQIRCGLIAGVSAFAVTTAGCSPDTPVPQRDQRHPDRTLLYSTSSDVPIVSVSFLSGTQPIDIDQSFDSLAIGSFGGEEDAIGEVGGATRASNGDLLVLDLSAGVVRVFREDGTPVSTFGGFGGGPGEFAEPRALVPSRGDTVLVVDAAFKIHRFARSDAWTYVDQINLRFLPQDACASAAGLAIQAPQVMIREDSSWLAGTETIHFIDNGGRISKSVGSPYRSTARRVQQVFGEGRIACGLGDDLLWVAYSTLGEIHSLTGEGAHRWIVQVSDFSYPPLIETSTGGVRPEIGDLSRIDFIRNAVLIDAQSLAVTIESRAVEDIEGRNARVSFTTLVLDASDGQLRGRLEGFAVVGHAGGDPILYRQDPFPQVAQLPLSYLRALQ
jgi:hypothetical protein